MNETLPVFPACERVTGVLDDFTYTVRSTGAWEVFKRGQSGPVLASGVSETLTQGAALARKAAESLKRAG